MSREVPMNGDGRFGDMDFNNLRKMCSESGLSTEGKRAELEERLNAFHGAHASSVSYSKFPRLLPSDASALHSTENGHLKGPGLSHVGNVGLIVGKREAPAADSYGKLTQEGPLAEVIGDDTKKQRTASTPSDAASGEGAPRPHLSPCRKRVMLNAMDIVLKHMEGTVMHPQTCKTLLRINKIFQQEGDYVAGAIKYPFLCTADNDPEDGTGPAQETYRLFWRRTHLLTFRGSKANPEELCVFYKSMCELKKHLLEHGRQDYYQGQKPKMVKPLFLHTNSCEGGSVEIQNSVVLRVMGPAFNPANRRIVPPRIKAGWVTMPVRPVLSNVATRKSTLRYYEIKLTPRAPSSWSVGLVFYPHYGHLLVKNPQPVGTARTGSVGISSRGEGQDMRLLPQGTMVDEDPGAMTLGLGLDEGRMEVFWTRDGRYMGLVADRDCMVDGILRERIQEGGFNLEDAGRFFYPIATGCGCIDFSFNLGQSPFLFDVFGYVLEGKEAGVAFDPEVFEDKEKDAFWCSTFEPSRT